MPLEVDDMSVINKRDAKCSMIRLFKPSVIPGSTVNRKVYSPTFPEPEPLSPCFTVVSRGFIF